jgi:hypothetical protein
MSQKEVQGRAVRVHPSTLHRELQGEGVLLQLDSGEYFGLDEVAQRMWELIAEHGDLAVVQQALVQEYDADPETLWADLQRLVGELVDRGLLEVVAAPSV